MALHETVSLGIAQHSMAFLQMVFNIRCVVINTLFLIIWNLALVTTE